ncbi:MAG: rhomboid family intramembrane serine protease [Candidatus Cloacimonetes bacterium]|nr:rhomboid family intramembrane serine protease [Candidatus Cloacimonadota bacterium]
MSYFCPNDETKLEPVTKHGGRTFICPKCKGEMINIAVLKRKPELRGSANAIWDEMKLHMNENGNECPQCEGRMARVQAPGTTQLVDVCKPCQSIWLDRGQFELLPRNILAPTEDTEAAEEEFCPESLAALSLLQVEPKEEKPELMGDMACPRPRGWKLIPALLLLPVKDDDAEFIDRPYVTWLIAALCTFLFVFFFRDRYPITNEWGFLIDDPFRKGGLTLLTSFFVHNNIFPFIFNIYFLLVFGGNVEEYLGTVPYIILLLLSHLTGLLIHATLSAVHTIPAAGLGAGVAAIIVYYVALHPQSHLRVILFYFIPIRFKAYWFLIAWAVFQLSFALSQMGGATGIVNAQVNVGGALIGFLWALRNRKVQLRKE